MAKILLVEDDKSLREIYYVRLKAEGYDIVSAGDGEEALAIAIKERPDLIVSDVMMPKISGFDMLDILRSTTETKDIKVIMMTALSSEDQRARGEALGANRYLVKSQVGIEDVVRTVHDVLGDGVPGATPAPSFPSASAPAPAAPATPAATAPLPEPTPAPVTPLAPTPEPTPIVPPVINMPAEPAPAPASTAPITIEPLAPTTPAPAPAFSPMPPIPTAPAPSTLPEPTAPFSSPAPASLGDRIINPITPEGQSPINNIADQMNQELNTTPAAPVLTGAPTSPPPAPVIPPAPGASL